MGSELLTEEAPPSCTDQFYNAFPYYLSIGMTAREYWHGDSMLPKYYRKAHKMRLEHENYNAWLQGAYVYDAISAVSPVLHAFAKKGTKPVPYLKEPYGTKNHVEKTASNSAEAGAAKFHAFAEAFNKKFKEKGGGINADN